MDYEKILSLVGPIIAAITATGPYGILAMAIISLGGFAVYNSFISKLNRQADQADQDGAGQDAGNTSLDLKNQTDILRNKLKKTEGGFTPEDDNG